MKKMLALLLAFLLAAALLAACGETAAPAAAPAPAETDFSSVKTFGDLLSRYPEALQSGSMDNIFFYAFQTGDTVFRAVIEMPQDISDSYYDLDWFDDDHDVKRNELLAPLEIKAIENISEMAANEADVNAYIGKTGGDLLDDGFYLYFWNLETMEFGFTRGTASYNVVLDGAVAEADWDDFSDEDIRDMTVKSMTFEGVGDAAAYEP
ncbi:MAG: hypothetical protein J6P48_05160 [Oscillospiraceae bacterium]|nr:hypothetical protein [Oscillospiraceae bacterium]